MLTQVVVFGHELNDCIQFLLVRRVQFLSSRESKCIIGDRHFNKLATSCLVGVGSCRRSELGDA
jgi:hypothetical protein